MSDAKDSGEVRSRGAVPAKKIVKIAASAVLYAFVALCVIAVVLLLMGKGQEDGATTVFGYQLRTVLSGSMDENDRFDASKYEIGSLPVDTMVFIETVPDDPAEEKQFYNDVTVGDVLTFEYVYGNTQHTITHRVVKKEPVEGGYRIYLWGDNNNSGFGEDCQIIDTSISRSETYNYVVGKVVGSSRLLGEFVTFIKKPVGMIFTVIIPCFAIILFEVLRVVRVMGESKRGRLSAERQEQAEKIAELERELEKMRKNSKNDK